MKKAGVFVAIFTPTACSVLKKKKCVDIELLVWSLTCARVYWTVVWIFDYINRKLKSTDLEL